MKRRDFLKSSALAAAGFGLAPRLGAAPRPNVLLIEVDQMRTPRWTLPDITPNIDRLAANGVSFTRHFTSAVPCSPSRACLFTGTYTTQNKMLTNCDFVEGNIQPSLDPKIPTTGHVFKAAGYQTPYRGKWHLSRGKTRDKKDPLIEYGYEGWKPPDAPFGGPPYNGALMDPVYARQAVEWLGSDAPKKGPWFLVCNLINPHDICAFPRYYPHEKLKPIKTPTPPGNWNDDLKNKPSCQTQYIKVYESLGGKMDVNDPDAWRRYLDYYAKCLADVDGNVGRVLDALERSGQRDNTIVVFTSDHGEMGGSHKLRTKGCFAYEEVMNVPLIFAWPGRIKPATTEALASNVDVFPTLAAMAGLSGLPYLAGRDLSPVLADPAASVQDQVLYHTDWEVQFKVGKKADAGAIYDRPWHVRAIRDRDWKYAYYFAPGRDDREYELYDLKNDPIEMHNLASDPGYQQKRKEMSDRLDEQEARLLQEYAAR